MSKAAELPQLISLLFIDSLTCLLAKNDNWSVEDNFFTDSKGKQYKLKVPTPVVYYICIMSNTYKRSETHK